MKEIVAIIRVNKTQATKKALGEIGIYSMTICRVLGRGKQKGLHYEITGGGDEEAERLRRERIVSIFSESFDGGQELLSARGMRYIPKRMLTLAVADAQAKGVIEAIVRANQTGHIGDGKIFVSSLSDAVRVRTGERGEIAIL